MDENELSLFVIFFKLCLQSIPVEEDFPPQGIKDSNRFKVIKSFVQ